MTFKLSFVLIIFSLIAQLVFLPSNASELPAEKYWKAKLGDIPMPKSLKNSLQLGSNDGKVKLNPDYKHNSVPLGPNRQNDQFGYAHQSDQFGYAHQSDQFGYAHPSNQLDSAHQSDDQFGYAHQSDQFGYAHPSNQLDSAHQSDDQFGYAHPNNDQFGYAHPAAVDDCIFFWGHQINKSQIPQDGRTVYFTNDKSFRAGAKMKLHFNKIDNEAKFLPLNVAKSLPASSDKLKGILNLLSVNPKSILARDIKTTMKVCEEKGVKGEKRYCATSLEAMVDYVTSTLDSQKNKLMVLATKQDNDILMDYTIQEVQKLGSDDNHNMVCHKLVNPYVVFLCHNIKNTDIYHVSLVGADGQQGKAVAVCHKDTSTWNPRHYAFQFLKTKPGTKPICHFVSADALVWVPNKN